MREEEARHDDGSSVMPRSTLEITPARSALIALESLVLVGAVGWFASQFRPGAWYAALDKPPWTPPDAVFGPVWGVLYVAIALAGWLIFARLKSGLAQALWLAQLVLNGLWSWLFFGLHRPGLALADLMALVVCLVVLLAHLWPRQPASFWLLLPYALWTGYALSLNAGVVALN